MLSRLKKSRELAGEFCDRCAWVCDAGCRAAAVRERAVMQALWVGVRI